MEQINSLNPRALWKLFSKICAIPHPSGHEKPLTDAIAAMAERNGLRVRRDTYGNLRIDRAAAPGFESKPTVILQGHLDMVPQADANSLFDFEREPIPVAVDKGFVRSAARTTLGADNGIGVAAALALLFDKSFHSGALAAIFTLSEEVGLIGAMQLDPVFLSGKYLLNLDSEDEGTFFIGCSGGARLEASLSLEYESPPPFFTGAVLEVKNLAGGHSGCNIAEGRGNAVRFLGAALRDAMDLRAASAEGGSLDNVIPREAKAEVALNPERREETLAILALLEHRLRETFHVPANFAITLTEAPLPKRIWTKETQKKVVFALSECPDGMLKMDETFGIPRTSTNLAAVFARAGEIVFRSSQRGLSNEERREVTAQIAAHFAKVGATTEVTNEYPGWLPAAESNLLTTATTLFRKRFGRLPLVQVIPAGLECGIFSEKRPELDMISFGPTILDPHSPFERVEIASVERFFALLQELVSNL